MRALIVIGSLLLAGCNVSPPITEEWFAGRWEATEGDVTSVVEADGSTLWSYVGGGNAERGADALVIEQYRVISDAGSRCMTLRTNGDQRVMRLRFRGSVPASPEIVAAARGQLAPAPDREYRACRDGEALRLGMRSGDGELELIRYARVEATGPLPLAPPNRSDLENMCGLSCNPQSSGFNACFTACRRIVESLPPLTNVGGDTVVSVPATATRMVSFNEQRWELNLWGAANAVGASRVNENAGLSDDHLIRFIFGSRTTISDAEAQVLLDLDAEAQRNGEQSFMAAIAVERATEGAASANNANGDQNDGLLAAPSVPAEEPRTFRDCPECPEMVVISGYALSFAAGRYEVSFDQWDACVAAGGCNGYAPSDNGWGRGNRPVINVSWNDAQTYVQWLSERTGHRYRLLTGDQWQFAARAGTRTRYSWGDESPVCDPALSNGANFNACEEERTWPVGSFKPNPWGLHDLHGNVQEWVYWCPYPGCTANAYVLGGAWNSGPNNLRWESQRTGRLAGRYLDVGFRVAKTL